MLTRLPAYHTCLATRGVGERLLAGLEVAFGGAFEDARTCANDPKNGRTLLVVRNTASPIHNCLYFSAASRGLNPALVCSTQCPSCRAALSTLASSMKNPAPVGLRYFR